MGPHPLETQNCEKHLQSVKETVNKGFLESLPVNKPNGQSNILLSRFDSNISCCCGINQY